MITDELHDFLVEQQVNFKRVGDVIGLPTDLVNYLDTKQRELSFNSNKYVVLCINYGGRNEIIRGIKNRAQAGGDIETLSEQSFSTFLDFGALPPVDLVIRTKG